VPRFVYAARDGIFWTALKIGDHVKAGAVVGRLGAHASAPLIADYFSWRLGVAEAGS
jgi:predicted deacylase